MKWKGQVYEDAALSFGLSSAPQMFNAVADALQWLLEVNGVRAVLHYLDDFLVLGSPSSQECE